MEGPLDKALRLYAEGVLPYMKARLQEAYGAEWGQAYLQALKPEARERLEEGLKRGRPWEELLDIVHIKDVLLGAKEVFSPALGRNFQRAVTWADEIREVRNRWGHQKEVPPEDLNRTLDSIARFLRLVGEEAKAEEVRRLLAWGREAGPPAQTVLEEALPPWWRFAEPEEEIRRGAFDENAFAAKLDDVVQGLGAPEYRYADLFFQKTHLTLELKAILKDALRRLSGGGGPAVVQLRTAFGGGKTHTLIALYHLFKASREVEDLPEVQALLAEAGLDRIPRVRVATLVGTELSPEGRREEGLLIRTLWGELAYRLGGRAGYEGLKGADEARLAPGKALLRELLLAHRPALILMDEILEYQVKAAGVRVGETTLQAQTFSFLQELTEVAGSLEGVLLVTTFPESHVEYFDAEGAEEAFSRLERIFGRVQAVRIPVQGDEVYEVLRRRLFARVDLEAARPVLEAYAQLYEEHREALPPEVRTREYRERMQKAFPFHPELVQILLERWGTLPRFQRTRGVLRLLARTLEALYLSPQAGPLVGPGDLLLERDALRGTLLSFLPEPGWEAVLASDVIPPRGKAHLLDREMGGLYARFRLAQALATAIFLYSHSGGRKGPVGRPRLNLALIRPGGANPLLVGDGLEKLEGRLYYLYANGGYSFRIRPNLNGVLEDRMAQVPPEAQEEKVREALKEALGQGVFRPYLWPQDHREVPDDAALKLILLGPEAPYEDQGALEAAYRRIQDQAAGTFRTHKNTTLYLVLEAGAYARAREAAKRVLALEDIQKDRGLLLEGEQLKEVEERLRSAREALWALAKKAYAWLLEPLDAKGGYRLYDLRRYAETPKYTLLGMVEEVLREQERLLLGLDPGYLRHLLEEGLWPKEEPFLPLRRLRALFTDLPHLPFLAREEALKEAVLEGARRGFWALAERLGEGFRRVPDPSSADLLWREDLGLVRPGVLPEGKEEKEKVPGGEGTGSGRKPGDGVTPPPELPGPKRLLLRLPDYPFPRLNALTDLVGALRDAGGEVRIEVRLEAEAKSPKGLDRNTLETVLRELLDQLGLKHEWEEG